MNLSRLEKANQGFEKLKKLDAEIIQIEKKGKIRFDADGSLINDDEPQNRGLMGYFIMSGPVTAQPKHEIDYKETISDVFALQVLGLLIQQKQAQRVGDIENFREMGDTGMKARHEFGTPEQWYDYLRTYFASQAMIGLQSACNGPCGDAAGQENIAVMSVSQAEYLLKQLQK